MKKHVYPLRISEGLMELVRRKSHEERTDQATALRQWLYVGAEEYVLDLLQQGRVTLSQAAQLLELSVYDVQRLAQEQGISIGATANQAEKALETATSLGKKRANHQKPVLKKQKREARA